jgi:Icc-related predicted phosphoesterase
MKIALLSDLHLDFHLDGGEEFLSQLDFSDCDLTVIAGDLSEVNHWRWDQNVRELCAKSKQVLYVAGNHCYYGSTFARVDAALRTLELQIQNLWVATKARVFTKYDIPYGLKDLSIIAGTLWFENHSDQDLYKGFSDFKYIPQLEPEVYKRNLEFQRLLAAEKDKPCIVVTHHLPSYQSVPLKYIGQSSNRFFVGAELAPDIENSKIKLWCHGHGHDAMNYKIGNTRIVSNPFGYPWEHKYSWAPYIINV